MAYIPRSSIGKNGTSSPIPKIVKKKRTFRIFGFIGTTMLVLSLVGSGGVFFLKSVSSGQHEDAKQALAQAEADVGDSQAKINIIMMYDEQLSTAATLLDNHLAPSLLFEALERTAKETVQYRALSYKYDPGFDALLTLQGTTKEFTSVVLQKLQLDGSSVDSPFEIALIDSVTKAQNVEEEGTAPGSQKESVTFSVSGVLKENRLGYTGADVLPDSIEPLPEDEAGLGDDLGEDETAGLDNEQTI